MQRENAKSEARQHQLSDAVVIVAGNTNDAFITRQTVGFKAKRFISQLTKAAGFDGPALLARAES